MTVVWFLLGLTIVGVSANDIFRTVIVPRPTRSLGRPSSFFVRHMWQLWRGIDHRIVSDEQREDFLGNFAPFALVSMLGFWILAFVVGYGLMFYAFRMDMKPVPDLSEALYFAGTSALTIGYGDFAPVGPFVRVLSLCAGASGLGAFAIITAFLFAVFGAYQQREAFVVLFTNRAGAPPSGVDMIETHAQLGSIDGLLATMRESQLWLAQVLETHLAYPILTYFRSTHDDISWIAVVGTILDASTLAMTTLDAKVTGEAAIVNRLARHFVRDFSHYFELPDSENIGIERSEFDSAYDRLRLAGIPLRDRDMAWSEFSTIRMTYASQLNLMANYWRIPPAQWVGDRSLIAHHPPLDFASLTSTSSN